MSVSNLKLNHKLLIAGLLVAAALATYGVKMKDARAAGFSGLTGTYSCMTNVNFPPMTNFLTTRGTYSYANSLAVINFTTGAINISSYQNNAFGNATNPQPIVVPYAGTFTESAGNIPGSTALTATVAGNPSPLSINILPANSGNTVFIQALFTGTLSSGNGQIPETGVCQKQ